MEQRVSRSREGPWGPGHLVCDYDTDAHSGLTESWGEPYTIGHSVWHQRRVLELFESRPDGRRERRARAVVGAMAYGATGAALGGTPGAVAGLLLGALIGSRTARRDP